MDYDSCLLLHLTVANDVLKQERIDQLVFDALSNLLPL